MSTILRPGNNCWRTEPAARWAFLIDADRYFAAVAEAIEAAERSIVIVGWDVHSRVALRRGEGASDDDRLGPMLEDAARRGVDVRILLWDYSVIYALEREMLPEVRFGWATHARLRLELANDHPGGASHHQKLVIVDGSIAFAGGIDLTVARWDRRGHDGAGERRLPGGKDYGPFHDAQVLVDEWAARALFELAAERWEQATGSPLDVEAAGLDSDSDPWPSCVTPDAEHVRVAIARTVAAFGGRDAVREVETLWLDAIAAAEELIYIENQYLTAPTIAEALAARLAEPDGPEVVVVTPRDQSGRLEELTMGRLRAAWVERLSAADRHGRLTIVTPLNDEGEPINVHAKVLVVDDRLVRVGSANLSRRSMRLDSECDLAFEAHDEELRAAVRRFRNDLIAEHLACDVTDVEQALQGARKGLAAALRQLDEAGRLPRLEVQPPPLGGLAGGAVLGDLDEPLEQALPRTLLPDGPLREARRRWPRVAVFVAVLLALAGVWAWSPLKQWASPEALSNWIEPLISHPAGPVVYGVVAAVLSIVGMPITGLIVAASLLFGPWLGIVAGGLAALVSALAGYGLGRYVLDDAVDKLGGPRLAKLHRALERRGVLSVIAVRVLPVAPFTVVNAVAGSSRVSLRDYAVGTALGMGPGLVGLCVAADSVAEAVRRPDTRTLLFAAAIVAVVAFALWAVRRWLSTTDSPVDPSSDDAAAPSTSAT